MNETEFVNGLDSEYALGNIEPGHIFGECVVLDEHGHEVTSGEELHNKVQILRILKRVI